MNCNFSALTKHTKVCRQTCSGINLSLDFGFNHTMTRLTNKSAVDAMCSHSRFER